MNGMFKLNSWKLQSVKGVVWMQGDERATGALSTRRGGIEHSKRESVPLCLTRLRISGRRSKVVWKLANGLLQKVGFAIGIGLLVGYAKNAVSGWTSLNA